MCIQFPTQDLVYQLGICLAACLLHQLTNEEALQFVLATAEGFHLLRVSSQELLSDHYLPPFSLTQAGFLWRSCRWSCRAASSFERGFADLFCSHESSSLSRTYTKPRPSIRGLFHALSGEILKQDSQNQPCERSHKHLRPGSITTPRK